MRSLWLAFVISCVTATHHTLRAQDALVLVQERISVQKCREYGQDIQKPCVSGNINESFLAEPKEFPHMALIGHGTQEDIEYFCSGVLISDQYVLSAAHCAASVPLKGRPKWIRLGEHNLLSPSPSSIDFNISSIITHPDFLPPSAYNDIVLFKLDRIVPFSESIRPACLSNGEDIPFALTVSGWGEAQGNSHQELKKDNTIKIVEKEQCSEVYDRFRNTRKMDDGVKDTQFCGSPSETEACHIKSGAPLQYPNNDVECMYNILGILSLGIQFCSSNPDIYTYVPKYLDWIESVVWPQTDAQTPYFLRSGLLLPERSGIKVRFGTIF